MIRKQSKSRSANRVKADVLARDSISVDLFSHSCWGSSWLAVLKETVFAATHTRPYSIYFFVVVVVVDSLCAEMCCPTSRTPTRSKPSPAAARASPLHLWCTSSGPPTAATDAYRGEQRPRCVTPMHVETQRNIGHLSVLSHLLLFF